MGTMHNLQYYLLLAIVAITCAQRFRAQQNNGFNSNDYANDYDQEQDLGGANQPVSTASQPDAQTSRDAGTLGRASQDFTISLMRALWSKDNNTNMILSPISISTALAMAMSGARGITESELRDGLHLNNLLNPHDAFRKETKKYYGVKQYQLNMGNLMFADRKFKILPEFKNLLKSHYLFESQDPRPARIGDPIFEVDFAGNPEGVRNFVNDIISEKTRAKIPSLLPDGAISSDTKLILANAIYFLGTWVRQFDERQTQPRPFYPLNGGERSQPTMFMKEDLNSAFVERHNADMVELPYKGGDISMYVLVPREKDGIMNLQNNLAGSDDLIRMINSLKTQKVHLYLPKFKLQYGLDLVEPLKNLGIKQMFDSSVADFSGISDSTSLYVSGVYHQATIDVDEKGTEAAAATAILFVNRIAGPPPYIVRADKPFLFFISDNRSGMVLFSGRVMDPVA